MKNLQVQEKVFVEEHDLIMDGFRLGRRVYESGFRPDFIVGIWRGCSAVGIVVQDIWEWKQITSPFGRPTAEWIITPT